MGRIRLVLTDQKRALLHRVIMDIIRKIDSQVPVAHTCNPSYSGDRDQEDQGSKPAQANSL
jgi:hypothetical protein